MTPAQKARANELYLTTTLTRAQIAADLGVTPRMLGGWLERSEAVRDQHGRMRPRAGGRPAPPVATRSMTPTEDRLVELYRTTAMTDSELAAAIGLTSNQVRHLIKTSPALRGPDGRLVARPRAVPVAEKHRLVLRHLLDHPCVECGYENPLALELHHARGGKVAAVSTIASVQARRWTLAALGEEVARCVSLCRNCHTLETHGERDASAQRYWEELMAARRMGTDVALLEAWKAAERPAPAPSGCGDCDAARIASGRRDDECTTCRRRRYVSWKERRADAGGPLRTPRIIDLERGLAECTANEHQGERLIAVDEFSRRSTGKLQSWCRACIRRKNRARQEATGQTGYAGSAEARDRRRRLVFAHKASSSCLDCGHDDPRVIEFDHRGDKVAGVMALANADASLERIRNEIQVCDPRCGNCHRIRTAVAADQIRVRLLRELGLDHFLTATHR